MMSASIVEIVWGVRTDDDTLLLESMRYVWSSSSNELARKTGFSKGRIEKMLARFKDAGLVVSYLVFQKNKTVVRWQRVFPDVQEKEVSL